MTRVFLKLNQSQPSRGGAVFLFKATAPASGMRLRQFAPALFEPYFCTAMKTSTFCLAIGASALLVADGSARDLRTTTGETLHHVTVTQVQPLGIRVTHDDGAGFYDYWLLTEADRTAFGFDPAAYAVALDQQRAREKRLAEQRELHF